jgi:hypothetical protein
MIRSIRHLLSHTNRKVQVSKFFSNKKDGDKNNQNSNKVFIKSRGHSKDDKKQVKKNQEAENNSKNSENKKDGNLLGQKENLKFLKNWGKKAQSENKDKVRGDYRDNKSVSADNKLTQESENLFKEPSIQKDPIILKKFEEPSSQLNIKKDIIDNTNQQGNNESNILQKKKKSSGLRKFVDFFMGGNNKSDNFEKKSDIHPEKKPIILNSEKSEKKQINTNNEFPEKKQVNPSPEKSELNKIILLKQQEKEKEFSSTTVTDVNPQNINIKSSKKQLKPIILKKFVSSSELDHDDFEHDLTNKSDKVPFSGGRKWEKFFRKNSKPFLDMNRAVNNTPNYRFLDFFNDLKKQLNDDQLLFATKNILINELSPNVTSLEVNSILHHKITYQNMDTGSKQNLLGIAEIYYLMPFLVRYPSYHSQLLIFDSIINSIKFFAYDFSVEEYLFILNVLLVHYNLYDSYLIQVLFERFNSKHFDEVFSEKKVYKIKYFGNPVNLSKNVLQVMDNYIKYTKSTKDKIPEKNLKIIENTMDSFVQHLNDETVSISDLSGVIIDFSNIFSVFEFDESLKWERAVNNLILSKINKKLSEFYPNDKLSIISNDILTYSLFLQSMKNDLYNQDLFEDVFNKLCQITKDKFDDLEFSNILFCISENKWSYEYINQKKYMFNTILTLIETSINSKIYNKNLIEPFLVCLDYDTSSGEFPISGWKSTKFFSKFLNLFGRYNFDGILKQEEFSGLALDCYFKILSKLDAYIYNTMLEAKNHFNTEKNKYNFETKISTEQKIFDLNKDFYTNFYSVQINEESEKKSLIYEKEKTLEENVKFFLGRFKNIPKAYGMFSMFDKEYVFHPFDKIKTSRVAYSFIKCFETTLDYMITLINYKLVNVRHTNLFIEILNELNSPLENSNSSVYDSVIKELILSNQEIHRKFSMVLNFIFFPKNYYDTFGQKRDESLNHQKIMNILKSTYDLEKYNYISHENLNSQKILINEFYDKNNLRDGLNSFLDKNKNFNSESQEALELKEFIEKYHDHSNELLIEKFLDNKRYEVSHKHFMNILNDTKHGDFYSNPNQLGLFNFDEIKEKELSENEPLDKINNFTNEEHFTLYTMLMDLAKISHTTDSNILNKNSLEEFIEEIENFYHKKKLSSLGSLKPTNTNSLSQNNGAMTFKFGEIRNLSKITNYEVTSSPGYHDYCRNIVYFMLNTTDKNIDLKKYKLDKMMTKAVQYFPLSPYFTFYAFSSMNNLSSGSNEYNSDEANRVEKHQKNGSQPIEDKLNWLIIYNKKYKNIEVNDKLKENEISYLKSQFDNILIFDN